MPRIKTCETCDLGLWHLTVRSASRDSLQGEKMQGLRSATQSKEDPPSNGALRLQRNQQDKPSAVGSLGSHVYAAEGLGLRSLQKLAA